MKKLALMVAGVILLGSLPGRAEPKDWGTKHRHGKITVSAWSAGCLGDVNFSQKIAGVKIGANLNLADDLKLNNPQTVPELAVDLRPTKRNRVYLSYFQSRYQGDNGHPLPGQPLAFLGTHFTGDVETNLAINRFKAFYQYSPLALKRGYLGVLVGADYYFYDLAIKGRINGTTLRREETAQFPLLIPVAGVSGQWTLLYGLGLFGQASGIAARVGGTDASYLDFLGGVQFKVSRLYSSVGYQLLRGTLDMDLNSGQTAHFGLSQQGVIASLGVNL
jgi:hypothetical protein